MENLCQKRWISTDGFSDIKSGDSQGQPKLAIEVSESMYMVARFGRYKWNSYRFACTYTYFNLNCLRSSGYKFICVRKQKLHWLSQAFNLHGRICRC